MYIAFVFVRQTKIVNAWFLLLKSDWLLEFIGKVRLFVDLLNPFSHCNKIENQNQTSWMIQDVLSLAVCG